jgi:hypothetical protein
MGISRSPSLVFIYLVLKKILPNDNFKKAKENFKKDYYANFLPYVGMSLYLEKNYPFENLRKILFNS